MTTRDVEHVIIGAGLAGLTMAHFLRDRDVVVVDPNPFGYRIGESLIPELFRHPELAKLLPRLRKLPSYTAKFGTTFVSADEVVNFPLARAEAAISAHVYRPELDQLLADAWQIDVQRDRVVAVDLEARVVHTGAGELRFTGQVIDCSGPSMTLATLLGEVDHLRPVHAAWAYHDVQDVDDQRYADQLKRSGVKVRRMDPRHQRIVPNDRLVGWTPSRTTVLTHVSDGVWCWQIPLFGGDVLSFGVVSRHGPIDADAYRAVVERHTAGCFSITPRPASDSPLGRLHQRSGFARQARRAASRDFILISDAYAFSDPVYSVGTAFAVNQAITVASRMNSGEWTDHAALRFCHRSRRLVERASAAFDLWYDGAVTRSSEAALEAQSVMSGRMFSTEVSRHYANVLNDSDLEGRTDPFQPAIGAEPVEDDVQELLGGDSIGDWRIAVAMPTDSGVRISWVHTDSGQELVMLVLEYQEGQPCFVRQGRIGLSYLDATTTSAGDLQRELFQEVGERVNAREDEWAAFVRGAVFQAARVDTSPNG